LRPGFRWQPLLEAQGRTVTFLDGDQGADEIVSQSGCKLNTFRIPAQA
jgi:hypothetical protein